VLEESVEVYSLFQPKVKLMKTGIWSMENGKVDKEPAKVNSQDIGWLL
jgi:hypothetical protein